MNRHPTPAEIRFAIMDVLFADQDRAAAEGDAPLPPRVYRLVTEGIKRACEHHEKESANERAA